MTLTSRPTFSRALLPLAAAVALCASAPAWAQSKKELANQIIQLQQDGINGLGRAAVEQPVLRLMAEAEQVLMTQVPEAKRAGIAAAIDADVKKFLNDEGPKASERAKALAPSVVGEALESKFNEEELKTILAWLQNPVSKKYIQADGDIANALMQKLTADIGPGLEPKFRALATKMRTQLGIKEGAAPAAKPAPSKKAPG